MAQTKPLVDLALDHPEILRHIFHPRPQFDTYRDSDKVKTHQIEVSTDIHIGAQFHIAEAHSTNILFFHGNGEIVADYDDIAPIYLQKGINFLAVDYRGYGRSTGTPSISNMLSDCHTIFNYVQNWLESNQFSGPLVVMGRSLGSASALEIAHTYPSRIAALIIESGFAYTGPLLQLLGVDINRIGFSETRGFNHLEKIALFTGPTLILHAQHDHIIPFSDGQALFNASHAENKQLVEIAGANHNDIFISGLETYMAAIASLIMTL